MHLRKQMVMLVMSGELSISEASRRYGVCRKTVREWVSRAETEGLENMKEDSRKPKSSPMKLAEDLQLQVLSKRATKPVWGARKILASLWPEGAPLSERTANRILKRHGLVKPRGRREEMVRFQRESPNELWQGDFKGLGVNPGYSPLSLIDDSTRFALRLEPLRDHKSATIWECLWETFAEYGLPERMLFDNESCFADINCIGPSWLESRLWLLGIAVSHGRPYHPQTQGKVERFHRTLEDELGARLLQPDMASARATYRAFLHEYNYLRPHESLDQKVPGSVYVPSPRKRPDVMPVHVIPEGATVRLVDPGGKFYFKGNAYRIGTGLKGEHIEIREEESALAAFFAGRKVEKLETLLV